MCSTFVGRLGRAALAWFLAVGCLRAGDYTCTNTGAGLVITGYTGGGGEVTIPSVIDGAPVVGIGDFAFLDCANLTCLIIPDCVARIGYGAFDNCSGLTNVTVGSGVAVMGEQAFYSCGNLRSVTLRGLPSSVVDFSGTPGVTSLGRVFDSPSYSVAIAEGVTRIGTDAFSRCGGLSGLTIPAGVTDIGAFAFYCCQNLSAVTIPAGVTNIGALAFSDCQSLAEVTIPEGVVSIGNAAFRGCLSLPSVTLPDSVASVGPYAFYECAGLTEVTVGSGIAVMGEQAFYSCGNLRSVTLRGLPSSVVDFSGTPGVTSLGRVFDSPSYSVVIAEGVTRIGTDAFSCCGGLSGLTIPAGVTDIGAFAFYCCQNLSAVTIPAGVTNIGALAFSDCQSLAEVTIPEGVVSIGEAAFIRCLSLPSVTLPDSVASVGPYAFYGCAGLTEVTVGSGIAVMGEQAFSGCGNLRSVTLRGLPSSVVDFSGTPGVPSLFGVFDSPSYAVVVEGCATNIGDHAFENCWGLTGVVVRAGVTNIGNHAFSGCQHMEFVALPDGLAAIGQGAFMGCWNLLRVTLPDSVVSVGPYAFNGCAGLEEVTVGSGIDVMGELAFLGCDNLRSVTLRGLPSSFVDLKGTPCVLSLFSVFDSPSYAVVVEGCATNIGDHAFENCWGLTGVVVRAGVTNIGSHAFSGCQHLESVTLPDGLASIGDFAFRGCVVLPRVAIPASVARVGVGAFAGCPLLAAIEVAEANTHFASLDGVLMNKEMTSLIQWPGGKKGLFTVPASVTQIEDYAFVNDVGPVSLYFKGDAPSVGENTFNIDGLRIYYASTAAGWGDALGGYQTTLWNPQVVSGSVGVTQDGFGFVISNAGSPVVVVEACTNLSGTAWIPVSTHVLSGGTSGFRDSAWRSHASRFYRFRMP